jgi:hypothetical protein
VSSLVINRGTSIMPLTRPNFRHIALILALVGALIQIIVAVGIIFLPIIALCGTDGCRYTSLLSYARLDMPTAGHLLLLLEIALASVPAITIISSIRQRDIRAVRRRCWLGVLSSLIVVYASWIFGLYFLPGGLLMLIAALLLTWVAADA